MHEEKDPKTDPQTPEEAPVEPEEGGASLPAEPKEAPEGAIAGQEEETDEDLDDPARADGNYAARYERVKERDIEKLSAEIEEKNGRNTKKKTRNWWIKTILLLLLIGLSIGLLFTINTYLSEDGMLSFDEMIRGVNPLHILTVLGVVILYILFESLKYSYLLKISTGKWRFKNAMKTMFLGKYYDGITPLGTGGQPFQIYYLHKKDIPAGVATAVPLVKFIITTFVFCIMAGIFFAITPLLLPVGSWNTAILIIAWVSMGCNLLIPIAILLVSAFPRKGKKFIVKLVALLKKMHLVKRKYPTIRKYLYEVDEYRHSLKAIFRRWYMIIPLVLICILTTFIYLTVPFAVALFVGGARVTPSWELYAQMLCLGSISFYASSLVPTPGNSGAFEGSSTLVCITIAGFEPLAGWLILFWRLCIYYLYIFVGIGINIFEIIRSAVRNHRAKKQNAQ